jgi:hypothetical protein
MDQPLLRVPGQLGLIEGGDDRHRFVQVDLGPDAGWPRHQDMSDWKRAILLTPRASLGAASLDREAATLRTSTRDLQQLSTDPELTDIFADDIRDARERLRRLTTQRLICLTPDEATQATGAGVPVVEVGYTRISDIFTFRAPGPSRLTASRCERGATGCGDCVHRADEVVMLRSGSAPTTSQLGSPRR